MNQYQVDQFSREKWLQLALFPDSLKHLLTAGQANNLLDFPGDLATELWLAKHHSELQSKLREQGGVSAESGTGNASEPKADDTASTTATFKQILRAQAESMKSGQGKKRPVVKVSIAESSSSYECSPTCSFHFI